MQELYFMACTVPNLYSSFLSPKTPMKMLDKSLHATVLPNTTEGKLQSTLLNAQIC